MSDKGLRIGSAEGLSRRRFLRNATITATAVPVIMTMSATGAKAATCSAPANRDDGCTCSPGSGLVEQCTAPATCNTVGSETKCCRAAGILVNGTCVGGKNIHCCSGNCSLGLCT